MWIDSNFTHFYRPDESWTEIILFARINYGEQIIVSYEKSGKKLLWKKKVFFLVLLFFI